VIERGMDGPTGCAMVRTGIVWGAAGGMPSYTRPADDRTEIKHDRGE
jgi:hypothetical protein